MVFQVLISISDRFHMETLPFLLQEAFPLTALPQWWHVYLPCPNKTKPKNQPTDNGKKKIQYSWTPQAYGRETHLDYAGSQLWSFVNVHPSGHQKEDEWHVGIGLKLRFTEVSPRVLKELIPKIAKLWTAVCNLALENSLGTRELNSSQCESSILKEL